MTTVRNAHAEPRPGRLPNGGFDTRGFLVVLADDAGHRAVPIWMQAEPGDGDLSQLLDHVPPVGHPWRGQWIVVPPRQQNRISVRHDGPLCRLQPAQCATVAA